MGMSMKLIQKQGKWLSNNCLGMSDSLATYCIGSRNYLLFSHTLRF